MADKTDNQITEVSQNSQRENTNVTSVDQLVVRTTQDGGPVTEPVKAIRSNWFKGFLGRHAKSISNVLQWLGFSVLIALIPILGGAIVLSAIQQIFSLEKTLAHGELLAISIALIGEAMRYLLTNQNVSNAFKAWVGLACVLVLLGSALLLGVLSVEGLVVDTTYIMHASFILFGATLIVGSFCKWMEK